jgi:hypothetical protein
MVERLREFADRPLDRGVARAILIFGLGITIGLALLVGLAAVEGGEGSSSGGAASTRARRVRSLPSPRARVTIAYPAQRVAQDPQDRRGSAARRRAVIALESHRALQHVPWYQGDVAIELVGATGSRAILQVVGPDIAVARRGYGSFLRRYDDRGLAYLPRFRARGGRR